MSSSFAYLHLSSPIISLCPFLLYLPFLIFLLSYQSISSSSNSYTSPLLSLLLSISTFPPIFSPLFLHISPPLLSFPSLFMKQDLNPPPSPSAGSVSVLWDSTITCSFRRRPLLPYQGNRDRGPRTWGMMRQTKESCFCTP